MPKLTLKNHHEETRLFVRRSYAIFIVMLFFIFTIITRLIYLQLFEHEQYVSLSMHNILKIVPIEPTRGLIYDRNGVLLAKNAPVFSLAIIPAATNNLNQTISNLQSLISISPSDLKAFKHALTEHRRYEAIPLKYKLTELESDKFYVNQFRFPGVIIQANMLRQYPFSNLMSDVLGYVGRINANELHNVDPENYRPSDYIGKTGIEAYYEKELHGHIGLALAETNASGEIVHQLKSIPPSPGKNLYITIDSQLQAFAEQALKNNNGALVAIQPSTGQILALVTKPSFDPNPFVMGISNDEYHTLMNDPDHPMYNRTIRGLYSPGSTIKPFHSLTGLTDGAITPEYTIYDPGWYRIPNTQHIFHDDLPGGHGKVNLLTAIRVSCDTYFYNLAINLGIQRIDNSLALFGFGEPTHVEMPHELPGILPTPEWKLINKGRPWYPGDTVNIGIGQGMLLVTPLQLANAVAIIANHGRRIQPHLTFKWQNSDNSFTEQPTVEISSIKLSNDNYWDTVIHAMEAVVDSGTALFFGAHHGYEVAGKTGTAQVYGTYRDEERTDLERPKQLRNNHLFIMFAPADNPQIALAIVIEHASSADTIAGQVTRFYLHELQQGNDTHATN